MKQTKQTMCEIPWIWTYFPGISGYLRVSKRYPEIPRKYVCILGISDIAYLGDTKDFLLCYF